MKQMRQTTENPLQINPECMMNGLAGLTRNGRV